MDNRIFNVNGSGKEMLAKTLELIFMQRSGKCCSWSYTPKSGLILHWYHTKDVNKLPSAVNAQTIIEFVWQWLQSDEPKSMDKSECHWDNHTDHDGDDGKGWRVYCDAWGMVDDDSSAICAIRPVVLWYGK